MAIQRSQMGKKLQEMNGYEFERFIAKLWKKQGWQTSVTSGSVDQGIDVIARRRTSSKKCLIQAKRYSKDNKVGSPEIQRAAGLYAQENGVDKVIVVTTSSFTKQAKKAAKKSDVTLINGRKLRRKIKTNGGGEFVENYDVGGDTIPILVALTIVGSGILLIPFTSWRYTIMGWWVGTNVTTISTIELWLIGSAILLVGSAGVDAHWDNLSLNNISLLIGAGYIATYIIGSGIFLLARWSVDESLLSQPWIPNSPTGVWIGNWVVSGVEIWKGGTVIAVSIFILYFYRQA